MLDKYKDIIDCDNDKDILCKVVIACDAFKHNPDKDNDNHTLDHDNLNLKLVTDNTQPILNNDKSLLDCGHVTW